MMQMERRRAWATADAGPSWRPGRQRRRPCAEFAFRAEEGGLRTGVGCPRRARAGLSATRAERSEVLVRRRPGGERLPDSASRRGWRGRLGRRVGVTCGRLDGEENFGCSSSELRTSTVEHRQCVVLAPGVAVFPRRKSSLVGCTWVIGARRRAFRLGDRLRMSAARMALPAPGQRERDGPVVGVR